MSPDVILLVLRLVVALALYAFLGLLAYYLFKDFRAAVSPRTLAPEAHLEEVVGPNPGALFSLVEFNLLGRAGDCTIRVPDKTISAHHGRLSFHASQWWLEDLGSRNGSSINDVRVREPVVVTYGDRLGLGGVVFRLRSGAPPESPPADAGRASPDGERAASDD
jgi:pSer/pThr/pTyr-binding forkhead associated (FHA) protein